MALNLSAYIDVDYALEGRGRNVRRTINAETPEEGEANNFENVRAAVDLLDELYLEVRQDLLAHLDEQDRARFSEPVYTAVDSNPDQTGESCQ